jgi:hypothetical protein
MNIYVVRMKYDITYKHEMMCMNVRTIKLNLLI